MPDKVINARISKNQPMTAAQKAQRQKALAYALKLSEKQRTKQQQALVAQYSSAKVAHAMEKKGADAARQLI